ncbi:C40 family peptidase [Peptococcus simiae]|uniref:C40 family peptidase n=1 Tax=Peptococcus simiae TaxID=1643805 RepID=UPI00397FB32B
MIKKTLCAVTLALATVAALGLGAQPAQAADPVYYVASPQQNDWHQVTVDQAIVNQEGLMYLPINSIFKNLGVEVVLNPDNQANKIKLVSGQNAYELYTYSADNKKYIGVSANGPWYQLAQFNGCNYIPMAFMQTLTNRTVAVSGANVVAFVDQKPSWTQTPQGYKNTNPFWRGIIPAYSYTPVAPVSTNAAQSVNGNTVIASAQAHMGVPYVWGGMSPAGFDCSGLTSYVFAQNGKSLPRTAAAQQSFAKPVAFNDLQPGDLVFWGAPAYHVGIYIGDGKYIHAPAPGQSVSIGTYTGFPFTGAGRV